MRRLLVFGTGAALIGIVLLIVAFYEAYLIVSTLQKEVGQQITNTNLLLEDATLEAVFLGVMAALGYGLVAKGLDGIRRQELLEMESTTEVSYGRGKFQSDQEARRYVEKPGTAAKTRAEETHPGIKATAAQPVAPVTETKPKQELAGSSEKKQAPIWGAPKEPLQEPMSEVNMASSSPESVTDTGRAAEGAQESKTELPSEPSASAVEVSVPESASVAAQDTRPGEVVWEGGAQPSPERGQVIQEPTTPAVEAVSELPPEQVAGPQVAQPVQGEVLPETKPKRGRGRPKESKSAKKVTEETAQNPSS